MQLPSSRLHQSTSDAKALLPIEFDNAYPEIRKEDYIPSQVVPVPDAGALPASRPWSSLRGTTYTIPEDFTATLRNVYYCTTNHVVLPQPGRVLLESMNGRSTFAKALTPIAQDAFNDVQRVDGFVTSMDANFNGYYHQLVELLPRLIALNRPPFIHLDEIKFIRPRKTYPVIDLLLDRINRLSLRPFPVVPGCLLHVEAYLFSSFKTRQFAGYLPEKYVNEIRSAACPKRPSARSHRIFISRERTTKRVIRNQDDLMARLSLLGFEKFVLEDMCAEDQIELFYDADVVIGAHGAGLTNVLFSPHAKVLELFPRDFIEPHYLFLCTALGHPYRYWTNNGRSVWDWEYIALRLKQRLGYVDRCSNPGVPRPGRRSNNLSFTVDIPAVLGLLNEMHVR